MNVLSNRRRPRIYWRMRLSLSLAVLALPASSLAQKNVDWPVYGGTAEHTHYWTISQSTPANVAKLQGAWT